MASGRRGGPSDLKSTLGSLLRTTLDQVGAVKDVVEQQARGRGGLIDQALGQRKRRDALAELGEKVYRLSRQGQLGELALDPEIGMAIAQVEAVADDDVEWHDAPMARRAGAEAVSSTNYQPPERKEQGEYRVWRPVMPEAPVVAEETEAPPSEAVVLETIDDRSARSSRMPRKSARRNIDGGIQFVAESAHSGDADCDDDLEQYMHEDDVS